MVEDYVILHHANVFIIEDNILCHLGGPSDHTGSHGNWLNGCKIDLITYPNPCNESSFSLVFPHFLTFLLIFMNMQMRRFSYRPRSSIHLSYNITGSTTKCQNDSLGLKLVYLWIFIPPAKRSFRGVYCFQSVPNSVIP